MGRYTHAPVTPAQVNTEVDSALNTAIPAAPVADSINERVQTLDNNYTAARAGYIDELAAANIPADVDIIKADTPYIHDQAINAPTAGSVASRLTRSLTNGTFSHANNTNEQDVLTFAAANQDVEVELDMVNLAQNTTIREYVEVDGATARLVSQKVFPTDFDTNAKAVVMSFRQLNRDYKITFQSAVAEGGAKDVPYTYGVTPRG